VKPKGEFRGIRMDLVRCESDTLSSEIFELKRASHLLLARRGKPSERLSREFTLAIEQSEEYKERFRRDPDVRISVNLDQGLRICNPRVRLVAGRRLGNANEYSLLSAVEIMSRESGAGLLIYTWDGLLAELERIWT